MKKRYTVPQIIRILKQGEGGVDVKTLCREKGIRRQTYYRWKSVYGGLEVAEAERLIELEDENHRLKKLLAERDLQVEVLKDVLSRNMVTPRQKRAAVGPVNNKRVERLYAKAGLHIPKRPHRKLYHCVEPLQEAEHPDHHWSLDFVWTILQTNAYFAFSTLSTTSSENACYRWSTLRSPGEGSCVSWRCLIANRC